MTTGTETVTGTENNDTITGIASSLSSERTLDTTDVIDGGAGTDTMNITMNTSFAGFATDAGISNVENINLTNNTTIARTFDASGVTGATAYVIDAATAAVNLNDVLTVADVELKNQASSTFTMNFADVADDDTDVVGNDEDAMTLTLNANGTVEDTATDAVERTEVTATINDIEELTLNLVGANVVALGSNDATTLAITGAGSLDMDTVSSALTSIDGSAATGSITIDTTAVVTAASLGTVKTGAGNDVITIDSDDIKANATIAGGEGADKVIWTAGTGATTQVSMTGVETVEVGAVAGAETISMSNVTGVTTINALTAVDENVSFVNMAAQALTVNMKAANANNTDTLAADAADAAGAATVNYTASAAVLADGTDNTAALANRLDLSLSKATSLTVNVNAYMDTDSDITAAKATSVALNIASGEDEDGVELTEFSGAITAALASSVNVNATGTFNGAITAATATSFTVEATGSVNGSTITAAAATSAEITTGTTTSTATNTMTVTAGDLETLTVNAGGILTITNTGTAAVQELTVDATRLFTMSAVALDDIASVSVGGTATTAAVTLGNLGDGDNDYDMAIVATGLKAGLTIGTIDIEDDRNISITASGMTGDITIGNIGTTNDGANVTIVTAGEDVNLADITATGDVSITNSSSKTFDVGDIVATDDVTLNLDATVGDITMGTIAGDAVVVDASAALGTVTYGATITATTSATVRGSELKANTATVVLDATSNDVSATLTGGIGIDTFTVQVSNATNDLTTLSVTGGVGADSLTLGTGAAATTTTGLTLSSIETLTVDNTAAVTVNASAVSAQTIALNGAGATDILGLTGTDSADTIDLTTTSSTGIKLSIDAGKGNDTIKLSSDADSDDTVVFEATAADNGNDTITGFQSTATGDVLDFNAFVNTNGVVWGTASSDTGSTTAINLGVGTNAVYDIASKVVFMDNADFTDTAAIKAGISDATGASNLGLADGAKAVIIYGDINDTAAATSGTLSVYYITGATGATDTLTLVGTVTVDNVDAMVATQLF